MAFHTEIHKLRPLTSDSSVCQNGIVRNASCLNPSQTG